MIYILELARPLGNENHQAQFYVGWCEDGQLDRRLKAHQQGRGAAFTRAANERGITYTVAATLPGDRTVERAIKNRKNTPRLIARLRKENARLAQSRAHL